MADFCYEGDENSGSIKTR